MTDRRLSVRLTWLVAVLVVAGLAGGYLVAARVMDQALDPLAAAPRQAAHLKLKLGFVLLALLAVPAVLLASRRITQDLARVFAELERGIGAIGQAPPPRPATVDGVSEADALFQRVHAVATDVEGRLRDLVQQYTQQEALLASISEAVIAVDPQARILRMNPAAERLFDVPAAHATGKSLREMVRPEALHRFIGRALQSLDVVQEEIALPGPPERLLLAQGTTLKTAAGVEIGALVALHDITRLRQLENLRREFVANVSHELRTPITSIRGFVETLRDARPISDQDRDRFLGIVERQAERLSAIVEDLLAISRLEQETDHEPLPRERVLVRDVVESAVQAVLARATERGMQIERQVPADLAADLYPGMIEQALLNLIDNSIKYADADSPIEIRAWREGTSLLLTVRDHGPGIEASHLPRLFERFYRVDRGRSRKLGGTGLGLAIVKHVAHVHGGTVEVESRPNLGSLFRIVMPGAVPEVVRKL